jgi:hypothetical protein
MLRIVTLWLSAAFPPGLRPVEKAMAAPMILDWERLSHAIQTGS